MKWNAINQHFLAHPLVPANGSLGLPEQPGRGVDLNLGKIGIRSKIQN